MNPTMIIALVDAAIRLAQAVGPIAAALKQNAELTPTQERELDERIAKLRDLTHWQQRD